MAPQALRCLETEEEREALCTASLHLQRAHTAGILHTASWQKGGIFGARLVSSLASPRVAASAPTFFSGGGRSVPAPSSNSSFSVNANLDRIFNIGGGGAKSGGGSVPNFGSGGGGGGGTVPNFAVAAGDKKKDSAQVLGDILASSNFRSLLPLN